jgi:cell fate (sporulation/competence/biofilm development) regulator YlbF (YheA/YmcA/DUF963 family)
MTNTNLYQLPDLMAATQSLVENLLAAEPIIAYRKAYARFDANAEARVLLQRLSQTQVEMRRQQAQGGVTPADVVELRWLQAEAHAQSEIVAYAQTQESAIGYLREINQAISELIGTDFAALAKKSTC